ncbi:tyrosine-type recombinase/integrase [Verrucomicrobiota bacterium sgz303538]
MKKPHIVKVGSTRIPIYFTPTGDRERYTVAYYEAGKRKRKVFDDLLEAKAEATNIATKLARGQNIVLELSATDRESYALAVDALRPFGIPLHVAIAEFIEARKALPDGCTLTGAVESFAQRHRGSAGKRLVAEVVAEFLAAREGEVGDRQFNDLRVHLAPLPPKPRARAGKKKRMQPFADRFRGSIGAITAADIDKWLSDVGGGTKRRNNVRASVVGMFGWAQRKGYLPRDTKTEAEMSERGRYRNKKAQILTPEQLTELVQIEDEEARLYFILGAFTGVRSAELLRLKWEAIHYETGMIVLGVEITKNGTERTVPIHPGLALWLAPYRKHKGSIFSRSKAENVALRFGREIVKPWVPNGLRHSYGSFRLAQTNSKETVSYEMGNSPAMVERHYKAIKTPDGRVVTSSLAEAWFSVSPLAPKNVLPNQMTV